MRELIVDNFAGGGRVRRILAQFFLDGMVWMDGKLSVTWKPVGRELLSRTLAASASEAAGAGLLGRAEHWLLERLAAERPSTPQLIEALELLRAA